jgi:choline-sulfatase
MPKPMNRLQFIKTMGGVAAVPFLPVTFNRKKRPNILLLLMDDMTYRAIGSVNNPEVYTPNLDRLARRGTTFTHAFNEGSWSGAVCAPARAMIATGLHLNHVHKVFNKFENIPLWGETFGKNGYETFFTGKWHIGKSSAERCAKHIGPHSGSFSRSMVVTNGNQYFRPHTPNKKDVLPDIPWILKNMDKSWKQHPNKPWHPYDKTLSAHWIESNKIYDKAWVQKHCPDAQHSSDIWTQAAIEFLKRPPGGGKKPLFMHVAFYSPHDPRQTPKSYLDRYPIDKIKIPPNFLPEFPFDQGDHKIRDEILAPFPRTPYDIQVHLREYYSVISYVDHNIGRIFDTLDETGMRDETIVIFTSDHGLGVGQQGLMGKQNLFDHSTRVPLIMAGPGIPSGHQVDHMLYHGSLFPTTCEMADIPIPKTVEKESFADLATGQHRHSTQQPIYGQYKHFQSSIRTKQHKLIEYRVNGQKHEQVFDLQQNPLEICSENLVNEYQSKSLAEDLRSQLRNLKKRYYDHMKPA